MTDPRDISDHQAKIDALWGPADSWEARGWQWSRLPAIRKMINRHVTGQDDLDFSVRFFADMAKTRPLPLERALVLACGQGELERSLITRGWVKQVVAIDISATAIANARKNAENLGIDNIDYRVGDMNNLDIDGPFDIIFSSSAIHHCSDLEGLFANINRMLAPDGYFFLDDYIGPSRFQWSDAQVLQINRLLQLLPDHLVRDGLGATRRRLQRPTIDEVIAVDPSEAVRSAEIVPLMRRNMAVEFYRGYGGNLLNLALSTVAQNFHPDGGGSADGPAYLDLLIQASDHLRATGRCQDDFAIAIAIARRQDKS